MILQIILYTLHEFSGQLQHRVLNFERKVTFLGSEKERL